jgi:hypothetical protein
MAFEVNLQTISVPASADLSTKQFLFGTINASGQVAVIEAHCGNCADVQVPLFEPLDVSAAWTGGTHTGPSVLRSAG